MPTYEYKCRKCGHRFEEFQSITEPPRRRCPICKGRVERLIGAGAGILFKGEGFYTTDYRSSEYRKREKADKAPEGSEPKGGGGSTGADSSTGTGEAKGSGKKDT